MKYFIHALFTLVITLSAPGNSAAGGTDPLPKDWKPDLSYVEQIIDRFYEKGGQQGFNLQTARVFEIRDAELAIVYLKLYGALPPKEQDALKAEQTKWLKYRDAEVDKVAPKGEARGTIAPMEENDRAIELTEARIKELKERFEKLR